jgi:kinesin family protein 18/19
MKKNKNKKVKFNIENEIKGDKNQSTNPHPEKNLPKIPSNKENMIVAVRVRPLNHREVEFSNIETVKVINREIVTVLDPLEHLGKSEELKNKREQQYAFDFAFDKNTPQEEVYMYTSQFLLQGVIDGFNATVFAYGATGAGKTYTMVGNGDNPGVMVRSLNDLFTLVEKQEAKFCKITISYIEVYNETLRDLLTDDSNNELDIREDPLKGVSIVGIKEVIVTNVMDVFRLLV